LGAIVPFFQAQVDVLGRIIGAEVLLRWRHPHRGWVSPMEFIPLAEETGLIMPLGAWVIEGACTQLARWRDEPAARHLTLSVNVSPLQFVQPGFVEHLRGLVEAGHFNPTQLHLELTEGLVIRNLDEVIGRMHMVRSLGIALSMDDFGTGQSSLGNLRRLPIQCLKIDKSFVEVLPGGAGEAAIASSIIMMAGALGLDVIAEGVETEAQRDALQALGCLKYQGYLFGRPVPLDAFEASVRDQSPAVLAA
jgi:EAL domain-containing protein (putative c-di-GMP-specific phosphodiesterase class I)